MKNALLNRYLLMACLLLLKVGGIASPADERVYVHTDREVYIAGETIFYKLVVSGQPQPAAASIAYLLIRNERSAAIARICIKTNQGATSGSIILPDTLQSGMYQLVAFTNAMRNAGEEHYFRKEILVANLFDEELKAFRFTAPGPGSESVREEPANPGIQIHGLKQHYRCGETVKLQLSLSEKTSSLPSGISVSVREVSPGMKVQSGTGVLTREPPMGVFLPETDGQIIRGRLIDAFTEKGIPFCCVLLSAKDSLVNLQYDSTDADGWFRFSLKDYYQGRELYIRAMNLEPTVRYRVETEDKFSLREPYVPSAKEFPAGLRIFIRESQDLFKVQRSYRQLPVSDTIPVPASSMDNSRVFARPDQVVYPSDFEPLADFQEISREILPTVRIRRVNNLPAIQLVDDLERQYFEESPALFINGVYSGDFQRLMPWGTSMIRKIEVVNARRVYGSLDFAGILAIYTRNPVELAEPGVLQLKALPFEPHTRLQIFEPVTDPTLPDFRQLLLWDPAIQLQPGNPVALEFMTSRHTGLFEISIEGVGEAGQRIQETFQFNVSQHP